MKMLYLFYEVHYDMSLKTVSDPKEILSFLPTVKN